MTSEEPVEARMIVVNGVSKIYFPRRSPPIRALEDVSLSIGEREFLTLVGPSGCGKSTLLKLIAGLQSPTTGTIFLNGQVVAAPSREVGIVFQDPVLLPWRSALDNVLLPVEILGLARAQFVPAARRLLALVGLGGFERHFPRELSGGMQQRVAICRSLIYDPAVLLMDEPFGALDAMTREELGFELLRIWTEYRKTILFVTHSIPEAVLLADRVAVMTPRPGRVAKVITVRLPRPRTTEMAFWPEFREHVEEIREQVFHRGREARP
ncbi:MAG: ABC transporter ATP-binding protein [Armatimonadota bacterium]|nr:ABC transporter ATP-binding protein [Armatimonadota bacterium]MDR7401137.1 ABC transporter ATP-binding protein [Armatimonadota bacterium]MDR7404337.1 ABC transporter ATP-binding protein [Armatimonadota bacterium]MDR7436432.1 ABC transporter ATP-binding protein [Armatimonadota bacterium]MDR7471791.1 ABC transporter ATP-binding protein [Armatimonadota bacterium]